MVDDSLTGTGHGVLWIVFFGMLFSSFAFYVMAMQRPASSRMFHYVTCSITFIASLAYLSMALGGGVACIETGGSMVPTALVEKNCAAGQRAFYYARYMDWTMTTPLLLLDLCLLCGAPWAEIFFLIVMDLIMVVAGIGGALFGGPGATDGARWITFGFGCLAFLPIVYSLATNLRSKAAQAGEGVSRTFNRLTFLTIGLWTAYPLVWAVSEGAGAVSLDAEVILYGLLDLTAKAGFGFILLLSHDAIDRGLDERQPLSA